MLRDIVKFLIIEEKAVTIKLILFIIFYFLTIVFMVGLLIFNIFHFMLIFNNLTTNEFLNFNRKNNQCEVVTCDGENKKINKYDVGKWENIKQALGTNPLLFLIPYFSNKSKNFWNNGLNFQVNNKNEYEIVKSV